MDRAVAVAELPKSRLKRGKLALGSNQPIVALREQTQPHRAFDRVLHDANRTFWSTATRVLALSHRNLRELPSVSEAPAGLLLGVAGGIGHEPRAADRGRRAFDWAPTLIRARRAEEERAEPDTTD
jgi:hypothetical protein